MKKFGIAFLSLCLLSGCFFGRSPVSNFFLLESVSSKEVVSSKKISLLVEPIVIPDLIYKPQIVLKEKEQSRILISEFNRWAEPLPDVLRQTLVDDLQVYLPNAYIKPLLYTTDISDYNYKLYVEINHFIGVFSGEAVLDVWWSLKDKNDVVVLKEKTALSMPIKDTYQSYIEAQSQLIGKLSKAIAEKIAF